MIGVLIRRVDIQRTDTDGRRPSEDGGRDGKNAATSQGMNAKAAGNPQKLGGAWDRFSLRGSERDQPC